MNGKGNRFVIVVVSLLILLSISNFNDVYARDVKRDKTVVFDATWPPRLDPALGQDFSSSICYANIYDSIVFPKSDGTIVNLQKAFIKSIVCMMMVHAARNGIINIELMEMNCRQKMSFLVWIELLTLVKVMDIYLFLL